MKKNEWLVLVQSLLTFLLISGCTGTSEKAVNNATAKPPVRQAANAPGPYLQACLKDHPGTDRKYCECFAGQMQQHLKSGATEAEKGRASGLAAMTCKNLH